MHRVRRVIRRTKEVFRGIRREDPEPAPAPASAPEETVSPVQQEGSGHGRDDSDWGSILDLPRSPAGSSFGGWTPRAGGTPMPMSPVAATGGGRVEEQRDGRGEEDDAELQRALDESLRTAALEETLRSLKFHPGWSKQGPHPTPSGNAPVVHDKSSPGGAVPGGPRAGGERAEEGQKGAQCSICWDSDANTACVPCGHVCGCQACIKAIEKGSRRCPVCRTKIRGTLRVYW